MDKVIEDMAVGIKDALLKHQEFIRKDASNIAAIGARATLPEFIVLDEGAEVEVGD